ncbi:hypothetical protein ACIQ9P_03050 [Kitasatospora sp. NPDC094019]|uniref:hypothetical protein n=1 Tax=Kitasatospora sp. NPDC094019 TaxID=3364091 RepID=UPI003800AF2E
MTDATAPSSGAPQEVLAGLGDLTRRVRAAQRGAWFPLLLFGVLTLGGILVDRLTFEVRTVTDCPSAPDAADAAAVGCTLVKHGSPLYWTIGFAVVYAATALHYVRGSRRRGVGTPVLPYVLAGAGLVALVAATAFWGVRYGAEAPGARLDLWGLNLDPRSGATQLLERFLGGAAAVGLPLLVLARVERSPALLLFALAYLVVELVPVTVGWTGIGLSSPWGGVPRLIVPGLFLLFGALGFALAQLPRQRDAA